MADVRCPMCGKPNPAELEVCQFCQARLKPLRINPSQEENSSPSEFTGQENVSPGDAPDWLHSLRKPDGEETFSGEDVSEDELPDWLSESSDSSEENLPESDDPDWLSGLRDRSSIMDESSSEDLDQAAPTWTSQGSPDENNSLPDWLTSMRSGSDSELQEELEPPEPVSPAGEEPEWLLKIRSQTDPADDQPVSDAESQASEMESEELFDFSNFDLEGDDKETSATPSQVPAFDDLDFSEIPDWLSESEDEPFDIETGADKFGNSEWLSNTGDAALPEEVAQEQDTSETVTNSEQAAEPAEEIPDWLAQLGQEREQTSLEDEVTENWLDFESEISRSEPGDGSVVKPFDEEDVRQSPVEEPFRDFSGPFEEDEITGEIPDWLSELEEQPLSSEEAELPDWLAKSKRDEQLSDALENSSQSEVLGEVGTPLDAGQELETEEPIPSDAIDTSFDLTAFNDEDLDWLEEVGASSSDADEVESETVSKPVAPFTPDDELDETVDAIPAGEVPEWLAEASPLKDIFEDEGFEEVDLGEEDLEEDAQPDLAQANLPSWVEAMRPVEASVQAIPKVDEDSNLIESIGPLAGLRGVLPAEPDISQAKKPPAYLIKLRITDAQRANAALLEQMIKTEAQPRAIPKRPAISSQHILRIIIAIVLIFAVVWPLVMGGPKLSTPAVSPGAAATSQLITGLNPDSPVLLAVDFEPGWSGEMDAIAAPVIDHLMLKGAFFALVSTTPSGPPQAEHLMSFVRQHEEAQLQGGLQYANLGFIPGGPAGLLSFAQTPQQVLPVSQDGTHVWESGPLAKVKSLSDFGMVVVITENPQTARSWIEQVKPSMGNIPLVMLTSAQAEPLVRPFYDAVPQQIQGFVSGLAGGMAYEELTGRSGAAGAYWNAFGLGLAVAGALIILGGLINAAFTVFARSKENTEGDE